MKTKNNIRISDTKTPQKLPFKKYKGFTLVELIVVITILVILGTISFLQLGGFAGSARDSTRVSNLTNFKTGLDMFQIKSGTYPTPENPVSITASGTTIGYQGFAKDQVASVAKLSPGGTVDPLDPSMYTTYSVNGDRTKMQIMSFLEDGNTVTTYIPTAYANAVSDYSKRFPIVTGDALGILLASGSLQPVQESGTGVDILNTTGSYTMYMTKSQQFLGTGIVLKAGIGGGGLVGYWSFDEGSGTLAYDKSGNGNNGSLSGVNLPSWSLGKNMGALNFNGTNSDIKVPHNLSIDTTSAWTLISWINRSGTGTQHSILEKYDWLPNRGSYLMRITPFDRLYGSTVSGYQADFVTGNTTIDANKWYFVVSTFNSATHTIKIYVNGVIDGINSNAFLSIPNSSGFLKIGSRGSDPATFFSGSLDEVRIYNRALSDSEIQNLYNATK